MKVMQKHALLGNSSFIHFQLFTYSTDKMFRCKRANTWITLFNRTLNPKGLAEKQTTSPRPQRERKDDATRHGENTLWQTVTPGAKQAQSSGKDGGTGPTTTGPAPHVSGATVTCVMETQTTVVVGKALPLKKLTPCAGVGRCPGLCLWAPSFSSSWFRICWFSSVSLGWQESTGTQTVPGSAGLLASHFHSNRLKQRDFSVHPAD